MEQTSNPQAPPELNHPKTPSLQNEERAPPGKSLGFRFCTYLVLWSFFFQTLWPSVAFGTCAVEVLRPPPSPLFGHHHTSFEEPIAPPPVRAVAPFTLQAFVDDQMEGFANIGAKPVVHFPGGASLAETQRWFDDSFEAQSLYPGLVVTEHGLLWSQYGLNFLIALSGHLVVHAMPGVRAITRNLCLHNFHGDVVFGGGLNLSHVQVQARNILQASPHSLVERLEIWAMGHESKDGIEEGVAGRFTNREEASLTTTDVIVHEGHLQNSGSWKVSDGGTIDLQGHDFLNEETVTLERGATIKNQGVFGNIGTVTGSAYTLEINRGENAGVIMGDAPHIKVLDTLTNQAGAQILGKSSLTVSGTGKVDNHGSVASKDALSLENKSFANHGLVHSEGMLRLALQEKLTNVGAGSVVAVGQTLIEGAATIQNDAPLTDHAGIAFGGGVHFNNFQGQVLNAGLMTSQTTLTGVLRKLVNTGTFGTNGSYQGFRVLDFLNDRTGVLLGDGLLTLTGINRGLVHADRLALDIEGTFTHEQGAMLRGKSVLETRGRGTFIRHGDIETPTLILDSAGFQNHVDLVDAHMAIVVGANAAKWKNHEKARLKVGRLTLETGRVASALDDFVNEGDFEIGTFINRRSGFTNRGQMTLGQWKQLGLFFKNELGAMIDVSDDSEVQSHTIDNDGDIQWGGALRGHIGQFLNQGGVLIKGDTHLTGTGLSNSKTFKALGIFDWVGETFQNRGKGKMALFDNRVVATHQVINEGLLLWTHNTFRTWHFLNLGWAEMTKDLTAGLPATFKAPTDKSTTFKKSMVENRGVLKIAPKDYKPRMTLEHSGDFAHWLNKGDIVLPETHLQAETLRNEGTFVVEGNLTGRVGSFENIKTLLATGKVDLTGITFANSGTVKGDKGVSHNGQTMTLSDGSEMSSKETVGLTTTSILTVRGKLQGKKGMTLTAPTVENHGKIQGEKGKTTVNAGWFTNHNHLDVDEWVYEEGNLSNFGKLEANLYRRTSPFQRIVNASGKSLIIRKGGFTAQGLSNYGKMELSDGLYRFEDWDNQYGEADIDQLCLALLNPLLEGKLDANVLVPFTSPYDSLTIAGDTVFRKGGFTTKKLTARKTLTLGDGVYTAHQLENESKNEIRLLPKTTLELKGIIDNQGEIVSDTGLEMMSQAETPASLLASSVTTPRLLLDSFWGRDKTSSHAVRRLGGMNITESLSVLFGTERHIDYFLGENISKWAIGQNVLLKGNLFENDWRTLTLPWPVEMALYCFRQKGGTLKTKGLKLESHTFKLGEDNDTMGKMEIFGPLEVSAQRDVDTRYREIRATGKTDVTSHKGNVLVGASKASIEDVEDEDTGLNGPKQKTIHQVELLKQNGAKIITQDVLNICSYEGDIITSFGAVHGDVDTYLYTPEGHKIVNKSGSITGYGRILLISEELENLVGDLIEFKGHILDCGAIIFDRYRQHPQSGPGIIASTGGDILINVRKGKNIGSAILTPHKIKYWNGRSYIETRPRSFELKEVPLIARLEIIFRHRMFHPKIDREILPPIPSPVRGGESIDVDAGLLHLTGTMTAPKMKVRGDRLKAHTQSDRTATVLAGDVEIDLFAFYKKLEKTLPVVADFIQRQHQKSIQDEAVVLEQRGGVLIPARSLSFGGRLPPLALTDEALKFTVMFVLSDVLGTLNVGGHCGDDLLSRLFKKAKTIEKQLKKEGELITQDAFHSFHEGMIYSVIEEIAGEMLRIPKMLVTPEMVNPYGNTSGAITGVELDLEFRDGVEGRPTLHAVSPILEKRTTGRVLEEDDDEDDNPISKMRPDLKLIVEDGPISMTEGLVKSDGKVKIETKKSGDIGLTSTVVEGEDDVVLQSAGNMTVASTASRTVQGENYADRAHQTSVKSRKGHLLVEAQLDTFFKGTNTYSKKGTTFKGNGRLVDETLALASKTVTREGKNWTSDIYTVKQPSVHVSDGHITETYQGHVDHVATHFVVPKDKEVLIFGFEGVTAHEDHNTHEHASHREKEKSGWFGRGSTSDFQSQSATSIGMKVTGGTAKVISGVGDIVLENVHFAVDRTTLTVIDDACKVLIKPGTNYFSSAFSGKSADMFWQTMTARTVQSQTYSDSQFDGELTIEAREAIVTQVCGRTLAFMDRIQIKDGKISLEYVHELYDVKEKGCSGPTAALSAVIAIAATMTAVISGGATMAANAAVSASGFAAGTMGASVISAMGYAGFSALCAQTAMALAQNRGDPLKSAQAVFQKDSLKAIAIAMGSAGVIAGLGQALNIPVAAADARGLADHIQRQALQQGVQAAFSLVDRQKLDPQRIAVSVAAQSLGAMGANKIGEYYTNQMVDGVTHKLLHLGMASVIGGLSGALTGDDVGRQALSAGIGALAAETMHDIIKEDKDAVAQRVAQKAGERGIDLRDTVRTRPLILDEIRARLEGLEVCRSHGCFLRQARCWGCLYSSDDCCGE